VAASGIERCFLKILWAKANKILPVHSGGDIRSYNIARQLAVQHDLTFFSYYDGEPDPAYEKVLREHFPAAVCLCTRERRHTPFRRGLDYVARLSHPAPYAVSRFASRAVESQLKSWYAEQSFDVAVCDFLDAAVNFPKELNIPTVLFQHNVESEIWRRHATNDSIRIKRFVYGLEFSKMRCYEEEIVRRFDHVIAVSERDKRLMSAWIDARRLSVVPTGVDTEQFRPGPKLGEQNPLVLFVGAMDWEANMDGVEYFCREIWPGILATIPNARLRIVGRNPGTRVQRLASRSVEVTGRVPSVVEHLREAAVVVVPLRVGGGTRIKIYEAMAMGKAVVSTSVGAEGLDVLHEQNILIADTSQDFSKSVLTLLQNEGARSRLERAAAELAANYGWAVIGTKFAHILGEVVGGTFRAAPYLSRASENLSSASPFSE
jgi:glycosyltransferase involved in cell wall biosynthesis